VQSAGSEAPAERTETPSVQADDRDPASVRKDKDLTASRMQG
jgi:hypothetical protein